MYHKPPPFPRYFAHVECFSSTTLYVRVDSLLHSVIVVRGGQEVISSFHINQCEQFVELGRWVEITGTVAVNMVREGHYAEHNFSAGVGLTYKDKIDIAVAKYRNWDAEYLEEELARRERQLLAEGPHDRIMGMVLVLRELINQTEMEKAA